jgi:FAD/FMN-containing dehydrogenase
MVREIAAQVRSFYERKQPFRVYHGSNNSTRVQSFQRDKMVDTSSLNRVISVDPKTMTALVEPNVPMDQLVAATLKYNLIPPVVMEFPGITVGGGLQGGAGESSSFKWGTFNRILNWYELVLGNGEVVTVSPTEHSELYYGSAGAYGSLGVVTAAQVQLIKAAQYVNLGYLPTSSFDDAVTKLEEAKATQPDFIDGIIFAPDRGTIIVGHLSDTPIGPIRRYSRARDPWYYLDAETATRAGRPTEQSVPLVDYLFRYDRGAFWMGRHSFDYFKVPFNRLSRWLLNPFFKTRQLYVALEASGLAQRYIIQDLAMPAAKTAKFMNWVDRQLDIYPIWLCPLLTDHDSPLLSNQLESKSIINVGVWGACPGSYENFVKVNRRLEAKVTELGGKKWFYAHAYYSEDEFWAIYDRPAYDKLRRKYHATNLPSVYDKVRVNAKEPIPVSGRRGVWRAIVGAKRPT